MPNSPITNLQATFSGDFSTGALKLYIIGLCAVFILAALYVDNNWILAGIAAYITLP